MIDLQRSFGSLCSAGCGLMVALVLCLSLPVSAAEKESAADDFTAIRAAVFDYLEGINEVNRDRLERAFHPGAELKHVNEEGELVAQPIAAVIERWLAKAPAARTGEITSIDINGGSIARVVFDYNGEYVDFLTLAKTQGRWKIVDKVFITQ